MRGKKSTTYSKLLNIDFRKEILYNFVLYLDFNIKVKKQVVGKSKCIMHLVYLHKI